MTSDPVPSWQITPAVGAAGADTCGPLVFASPHSGGIRPDDLRVDPRLSLASLRSAEDALVDQLIETAPRHGVPVIAGRFSRAYVDLNRSPDELDPVLIPDADVDDVSAKTAAGFGVIPRRAGDGAPLYDRKLEMAEAAARLQRVHAPYHVALAGLMETARARHGRAVLVDWHSMPARATGGSGRAVRGVDVVLGDRHGSSCDARLTRRLRLLFEGLGWRVALNHPYAGGYTTQIWGRPAEGFEAVQIELSRALYLDEATQTPGEGFECCRASIARVIATLAAEDWTL